MSVKPNFKKLENEKIRISKIKKLDFRGGKKYVVIS